MAESFPHLTANDIITFKIWLFDYKNFKMKTDEFPFIRQRAAKKKETLPKAQYPEKLSQLREEYRTMKENREEKAPQCA